MESSETMEVNKNPSGIGGWLAFFIVGLFVNGTMLSFESLNMPLDASNTLPMLMGLSLAVLAFSAAVLLLRTNPRGILLAKVFIGTNLLVHGLAIVGSLGDARAVGAASADMGRVLLFSLIWITYLQQSVRVKNTFGFRSERVDRATGSQEVPRIAETTGKDEPVLEETKQHDSGQDQSVVRQTALKTVSRNTTFRQIAREAVIFMLIGLALSSVGAFSYKYHDEEQAIQKQRSWLRTRCDELNRPSVGEAGNSWKLMGSQAPNEAYVSQAECSIAFGEKSYPPRSYDPGVVLSEESLRQDQDAMETGKIIKNTRVDYSDCAVFGIVCGAYGFMGGFGIWLFYRLIRFVVKG